MKKITGPANIRISPLQAWQSVQDGLNQILLPLGEKPERLPLKTVIGIAGCEVPSAYAEFLHHTAILPDVSIISDSYAACFGAHAGEDGAIIIIGTGTVGFQIEQGQSVKVGGWGFPHDDAGGGACLGLMAMHHTVQTFDGRENESGLSKAVEKFFHGNRELIITWANQASSTQFAQLAPLVIEQSENKDPAALALMQKAAQAINSIAATLLKKQHASQPLPYSLIGGIANYLLPFLDASLRTRIQPAKMTPVQGAVLLAKRKI